MASRRENEDRRKSEHDLQSSPKSNSSLDPKANEFSATRPTEQKAKQRQQGHNWKNPQGPGQYRTPPPGLGANSKGSRGGWVQFGFPVVPQILPNSYGQQYQQSQMMPAMFHALYPMPSFSSYGGYQQMYQTQQPMGAPGIPQPAPFYGGQQQPQQPPQQMPIGSGQGAPSLSPKKDPVASPQQPEAVKQKIICQTTGEPQSRTVSRSSSHAHPSPSLKSQENKILKYRKDFEKARSFDDDHLYFPAAVSNNAEFKEIASQMAATSICGVYARGEDAEEILCGLLRRAKVLVAMSPNPTAKEAGFVPTPEANANSN
ncbi:hypothetical protein F5Y12DRAFT_714455 [Xylaria sp. FL1777]|nr:hypothetical protein F5Y12DRAFT_714455 [Xylaria sp. FL1777]